MRVIASLCFAAFVAVTSTASISRDLPASSAPLIAKMHTLPGVQQKVLVMVVFNDVSTNFQKLEINTPKKALAAMKIHAVALDFLAGLAKQANCHECEAWFQEGRDLCVQRIRGTLQNGDQLGVWEKGLPKILGVLRDRDASDPALDGPLPDGFKVLRRKLSLSVIAHSKMAIWGPEIENARKSGEPLERSHAVQDEVAALLTASQVAEQPLLALSKKERGAALLASGGAINRLLQRELGEAKSGTQKEKVLAFRGAELALRKLAALAAGMGFRDAEACHRKEAEQMRALSRGESVHPAGCRPAAYPDEMRSEAQGIAMGPRGNIIGDLTSAWAKATYLYAVMAVKYGEDGDGETSGSGLAS